jgi:hypothetical protein
MFRGRTMNHLELTKWLLKVRDALAEQDEVRRNRMLLAADRFLNRGQAAAARILGDTNRKRGRRRMLDHSSSPNEGSNHVQGIN